MINHASSDWRIVDNINNMVFAKEFFEMIDEEGLGQVTISQLNKPLALLGLDVNVQFLMIALAVNGTKDSEVTISLKNFI
jgi:Ca2+-binding EF-hand superfamily protein